MNETEGNVQCLPKISMTHDVCVCVGDEIKASYRLKLTLAAGFFSVFGVFFFLKTSFHKVIYRSISTASILNYGHF